MDTTSWTLLDEQGATAVCFTSFLDINLTNGGQALSYPIEQGSFATYNKVRSPLDIVVNLGIQGEETDFETTLHTLDHYQKESIKLFVSTPATFYKNMTLVSYTYTRAKENNAGMLTVELRLVEVREINTRVEMRETASTTTNSITKPKNPSSAEKKEMGKIETRKCGTGNNAAHNLSIFRNPDAVVQKCRSSVK